MSIRLSKSDLARHDDCICPNNRRREENLPAFNKIPIALIVILTIILVIAYFSRDIALAISVLLMVVGLTAFLYRLIRGHSFRCAVYWGFMGGVHLIGYMFQYGWS